MLRLCNVLFRVRRLFKLCVADTFCAGVFTGRNAFGKNCVKKVAEETDDVYTDSYCLYIPGNRNDHFERLFPKAKGRACNQKTGKKKKMKPIKKTESSIEVDPFVDDGYDGYYDDVRPVDEGHEREGIDKELIKKIAIIIGVLFVVIAACVALMYVL